MAERAGRAVGLRARDSRGGAAELICKTAKAKKASTQQRPTSPLGAGGHLRWSMAFPLPTSFLFPLLGRFTSMRLGGGCVRLYQYGSKTVSYTHLTLPTILLV
eukprot:2079846-Pyramimonas_sp.AAC.1